MRWIKFHDGSMYTFAADIQKLAEAHGYAVPCEQDGTRHPGTDCNQKMRAIFKDAGMRQTFGLNESSVVVIDVNNSPFNGSFLRWAVDENIISAYYLRKGAVQLYTEEAVSALLSVMLKHHVEYHPDDEDTVLSSPIFVVKKSQNLEKKRNRPKASLFNK